MIGSRTRKRRWCGRSRGRKKSCEKAQRKKKNSRSEQGGTQEEKLNTETAAETRGVLHFNSKVPLLRYKTLLQTYGTQGSRKNHQHQNNGLDCWSGRPIGATLEKKREPTYSFYFRHIALRGGGTRGCGGSSRISA